MKSKEIEQEEQIILTESQLNALKVNNRDLVDIHTRLQFLQLKTCQSGQAGTDETTSQEGNASVKLVEELKLKLQQHSEAYNDLQKSLDEKIKSEVTLQKNLEKQAQFQSVLAGKLEQ